MFKKLILSFALVFCVVSVGFTQEPPTPNKIDGIELPNDQTVAIDEGFVNLTAKCKGEVKWLVVSLAKIKYVTLPQNAIIISIPPQSGVTITVFAIGSIDGKLTDFVRTNITTAGLPPGPVTPVHVTFLVDFSSTTPELAALLNSPTLAQAITAKGHFKRIYDTKSPVVAQKKLDGIVGRFGNSIVIQRGDGHVTAAQAIPRTEAEILALIEKSK